MLTSGQLMIFDEQQDVDFAFSWHDRARIRGSAFTQRGQMALALRMIPTRIPSFEELGLPYAAEWVSEQPRGFVLVTGPTGSGKSTTLASIIDRINEPGVPHPDHRGPGRVRPPAQGTPRYPARGRLDSPSSTARFAPPSARTPTSCWSARCATSTRSRSP